MTRKKLHDFYTELQERYEDGFTECLIFCDELIKWQL